MSKSAIALSMALAWFMGGVFAWWLAVEAIERGEIIARDKLYSCQPAVATPISSEPGQ